MFGFGPYGEGAFGEGYEASGHAAVVGSAGVRLSGVAAITPHQTGHAAIVGSAGVRLSGAATVVPHQSGHAAIVATGGVRLSGAATIGNNQETIVLSIAGVDRPFLIDGSFRITETANGRNTLNASILSIDGSYRPPVGAEVYVREGGLRIFGGVIETPAETGFADGPLPIVNRIAVPDFNAYADRRHISGVIPGGTLKSQLQAIVPYLSDYGITLDPSQTTGPSMPEYPCDFIKISELLAQLCLMSANLAGTGFVWDIDYYKQLKLMATGSTPAPFSLTSGDGKYVGDVAVEESHDNYANRVVLRFTAAAGSSWAYFGVSVNFSINDTVTIGGQTYTFKAALDGLSGTIRLGADLAESMNSLEGCINLGGDGFNSTTQTPPNSSVDAWNSRPEQLTVKAKEPGANGNNIAVGTTNGTNAWYWEGGGGTATLQGGADESLSNQVEANDLAEQATMGVWELVMSVPSIRDFTVAQAACDAYLASSIQTIKMASYTTKLTGVHPGQTQSIAIANRNLSGTFLVTDVQLFMLERHIYRQATVMAGEVLNRRWQDDARVLLGGSGSAGAVSGPFIVTGGGGGPIADNSVALAKLEQIASGTVLGRATTGTGNVEALTTLPTPVQDAITRLGTIASGVWHGSVVDLAYGGTGANLTATAGAVAYSTASALALTGVGSAGQLFKSAGASAPSWTTNLTFDETTLTLTGNETISGYVGTPSWVSQLSGWRIDGAGNADFRYVFADELHAKSFIADLEMALAGGQIISKSVAMVAVAFSTPALGSTQTLQVRDLPSMADAAAFVSGDTVVLRTFARAAGSLTIGDCVGVVTSYADQADGTQTWTFTRNSGAAGGSLGSGVTIQPDSLAIDYGVSGNGYYEVNAADGANAIYSPYAQIVTWTTAPTGSNRVVRTRVGNLYGLTAVSGEYGMIAGVYAATGGQFLRASSSAFELHGIDLLLWDGATNTVKIDHATPSLAMGSPLPSAYGTGTGIWMGKDTAYKFRVGNPAGDRVAWDGTTLTVVGDLTVRDGSITANKIMLTSSAMALNADPFFTDAASWDHVETTRAPLAGPHGAFYVYSWAGYTNCQVWTHDMMPFDPGKTYRMHVWAWNLSGASGALYLGFQTFDYLKAGISPTVYYQSTSVSTSAWGEYWFTVPAGTLPSGVAYVKFGALLNWTVATGYCAIQDLRLEEMLPASLIVDGAITTDKLYANAVTAAKIAANTITASQIYGHTITAAQIAANTITAGEIYAGTITGTEIAAGAITATHIDVDSLSAISADLGTVTAGSISGATITAGGGDVTLDGDGIYIADGTGNSNKIRWSDGTYIYGSSLTMKLYADFFSIDSLGTQMLGINAVAGVDVNQLLKVSSVGSSTGTNALFDSSNYLKKDSSSLRYKEHVRPWEHDGRALLTLTPIQFDFRDGGARDVVGFAAEDLYAIDPHLVNLDAEGRPESSRTAALFVFLLQIVKAQQARLDALEGDQS